MSICNNKQKFKYLYFTNKKCIKIKNNVIFKFKMKLMVATNSYLSIMLFLLVNRDNNFYIWYYDWFFLKKNTFFSKKKIKKDLVLSKIFLNHKSIFSKIISLIWNIPHTNFNIQKTYLKNEMSNSKNSIIILYLYFTYFFSTLLIFRNIYFKIKIKKWINQNNIDSIHIFLHYDPFSFFISKFSNKDVFVYDDGLKRYDKKYIYWMKKISIKNVFLIKLPNYFIKNKKILFKNYNEINIDHNDVKYLQKYFNFNVSIKNNSNILFTQPLSEDNVISEKEKIKIYEEIIYKYNINVIKPHPRETTNWENVFKNIKVIDSNFPSELLIIYSNKINSICTIFSTSIFAFDNYVKKIIFIGTKKYKKLTEKFGVI